MTVLGVILLVAFVAVFVGLVLAASSEIGDRVFIFIFGVLVTMQLSLLVATIYVAAHFIGKYW